MSHCKLVQEEAKLKLQPKSDMNLLELCALQLLHELHALLSSVLQAPIGLGPMYNDTQTLSVLHVRLVADVV